jgi:hypothetical protein
VEKAVVFPHRELEHVAEQHRALEVAAEQREIRLLVDADWSPNSPNESSMRSIESIAAVSEERRIASRSSSVFARLRRRCPVASNSWTLPAIDVASSVVSARQMRPKIGILIERARLLASMSPDAQCCRIPLS